MSVVASVNIVSIQKTRAVRRAIAQGIWTGNTDDLTSLQIFDLYITTTLKADNELEDGTLEQFTAWNDAAAIFKNALRERLRKNEEE